MILRAIPHELYAAVASGIGLFIALIGFRNAGLVVGDADTLVGLGNIRNPTAALALLGLLLMVALEVRKVRGAILIGVLAITGLAWAMGLTHWTPAAGGFHSLASTAFQLDIRGALNKGLLEIVFVFFFVDLFDNLGTLVAVTKRAGLIEADHSIPRLNRILFTDATATVFGSLTGTSTVTSYVESTAGVAAGGRSGVTAIVTGLLFLAAIGAAPFVGIVPAAATAPALILVGSLMLATIERDSLARSAGCGSRLSHAGADSASPTPSPTASASASSPGPRSTWPPANSANRTGCSTCWPRSFWPALSTWERARRPAKIGFAKRKETSMHWYHYVAYFFGGAFLANTLPHLGQWNLGTCLSEPLRIAAGQGLSSSTVNVLWGFFNLAVAYLLVCRVGSFNLRKTRHVLILGAGILLMSLMLARAFGRFHGGL